MLRVQPCILMYGSFDARRLHSSPHVSSRAVIGGNDIFSNLPRELLILCLVESWKIYAGAPWHALVCHNFKKASYEAARLTRNMDVKDCIASSMLFPLKPQGPPLDPTLSNEDELRLNKWGPTLSKYKRRSTWGIARYVVDMHDLRCVLGLSGYDSLTNFAVDCYFDTLMPSIDDAAIGYSDFFVPSVTCYNIDKFGVFDCPGTPDTLNFANVTTNELQAKKLLHARAVYLLYNTKVTVLRHEGTALVTHCALGPYPFDAFSLTMRGVRLDWTHKQKART